MSLVLQVCVYVGGESPVPVWYIVTRVTCTHVGTYQLILVVHLYPLYELF